MNQSIARRGVMRGTSVLALAAAALLLGAACDDDTQDAVDSAKSTVTDLQNKAGEAGARGVAEAYRAALKAEGANNNKSLCNESALQSAADKLPGDPDVEIIDDDGADNACFVQVTVSDQSACVEVPTSGDNVDVSGGTCPSR